ncbi:MAG: hypothetical protein P8I04_08660 [Algibacter sp.]|uniref:hypothetical protein n=1 Tax=Algibacter sp. TaxID=1872428 RepID=UPI0026196628|nr:hypothetical protein [Algibacter sp.]MDG1729923.1 hypothetical protein [Algibacter sp.]
MIANHLWCSPKRKAIFLVAMTFTSNLYDGHNLEDVLEQNKNLTGKQQKQNGR